MPEAEELALYIFWFLHQTTTQSVSNLMSSSCISFDSYIKPQLQAKSMHRAISCISFDSYIKPQPVRYGVLYPWCCISFDSYIKPQPIDDRLAALIVVYLLIPTSNHNSIVTKLSLNQVVYLLIPTSNHNRKGSTKSLTLLYIFWFLHQTTTGPRPTSIFLSCISFDSYIKPQHIHAWCGRCRGCISFDSYIKPQLAIIKGLRLAVVYLLIPTSNHNCVAIIFKPFKVVYLLIPTSNHNSTICSLVKPGLYIFWFLHQTTTLVPRNV